MAHVFCRAGPSSPAAAARWNSRNQLIRSVFQPAVVPSGGVTSSASASRSATVQELLQHVLADVQQRDRGHGLS